MSRIIDLQEKSLPANCYVFKHSTACPISGRAAEQVRSADLSMDLYWVNVIEQRDLSNWLADNFEVKHESPQLLMIRNAKAEKVWSHGSIKKEVFISGGS